MNESILTSPEVCLKYHINKYTLLNWRRGFYFGKNGKVYFFLDETHLETEWNEGLRRLEYNPVKVAVWVSKMKHKGGHYEE